MSKITKSNSLNELFQLDIYPIFDEKEALEKTNDVILLKEMLEIMLKDTLPEELSHLKTAQAAKDWETAIKIAHKLKGGSVYCGTIRMTHACQSMEQPQMTDRNSLLEKLCQQLITVIEQTQQATRTWLANKLYKT